jgi:hypothetical protein
MGSIEIMGNHLFGFFHGAKVFWVKNLPKLNDSFCWLCIERDWIQVVPFQSLVLNSVYQSNHSMFSCPAQPLELAKYSLSLQGIFW